MARVLFAYGTIATRTRVRALVLLLVLSSPAAAAELTIDASTRFQTIQGWGTSLIGWSLSQTPYNDPAWRAAYRDLGCNILRIPMIKEVLVANRSYPDYRVPVPLGDDLQANINLMEFRISPLTTWADIALWLKSNALEPDRVLFTGSPWSPPHWMKGPTGFSQYHVTNPSVSRPTPWLIGTTAGDSIGGRLKTEDADMLQMYGRYLAAWVRGFEQTYGLTLYAISLQNEASYENPFDSMTFVRNQSGGDDPAQYAMGLKSVKNAWSQYGLTTKVMGPHMGTIGSSPANPWGLLIQMNMIDGVKDHLDAELIDFLSFYNSNYYMGTSEGAVQITAGYYHGKAQVPADWAFWAEAPGVKQDGKSVWYSESSGEDAAWLAGSGGTTPGDGAITVALKVHNALVFSDAVAYVYWQMSDTHMDETAETLLGRSHVANPHGSKKYCSYKHFSRHIRPGAQRIRAIFRNGQTTLHGRSEYDTAGGLSVSAYLHETDQTLTCVLINMRPVGETITILFPALATTALAHYRTSQTESFLQLPDVTVASSAATLDVPGYSVATLTGPFTERRRPDLDADGDVDQSDFGILQACLTGAYEPQAAQDCLITDLDADGDTDAADLDVFEQCMGGPGNPVPPACPL